MLIGRLLQYAAQGVGVLFIVVSLVWYISRGSLWWARWFTSLPDPMDEEWHD